MHRFNSLLPKQFLLLGVIAFLFLNVFGLSLAVPMTHDGHMPGCPFMGGTAVCQMNPFEHISAWQSMFTSTAAESSFSLLLLTLMVVAWCAGIFKVRFYPEIRAPLQYHQHNLFFFRSPLQEAFSNGILNPKIF